MRDLAQERREQLLDTYAAAYLKALDDLAACARERDRYREALERIASHESDDDGRDMTLKYAVSIARNTLEPTQ